LKEKQKNVSQKMTLFELVRPSLAQLRVKNNGVEQFSHFLVKIRQNI